MTSRTVRCERHGEQEATFVCQHLVQSLAANTPYGFWWASDQKGEARPDAWCTSCNGLATDSKGNWTEDSLKIMQVKLLCGACYDKVRAMNNVTYTPES